MFRNYLIIAMRNLLKHKTYSLINILGLAIGMTCVILISLFIFHELSYDRHHTNADRIYRVLRTLHPKGGEPATSPATSPALATALLNDLPEIQEAVRVFPTTRGSLVQYGENTINQTILFAEPSILNIFTIPFIKGSAQAAFKNPNSIIITESMAHKIFGQEDPIKKSLFIQDNFLSGAYQVTGVVKDFPKTSTFYFDGITATLPQYMENALTRWQPNAQSRTYHTYILLPPHVDPRQLEPKLQDLMARYMGEEIRAQNSYHLQALTRMWLYANQDMGRRLIGYGDITHVYMFSIVGIFVLFVACINFMNLSTARSANRAREVGMRKVVGAHRAQLIQQFLCESVLLALVALAISVFLSLLLLPYFNQFMGKELALNLNQMPVWFSLFGLTIIVGILAGSYPALYLSAFRPISVLKGVIQSNKGRTKFRSGLVVFQFIISITLIIGTLTVYNQLNYMRNKHLGFDKENIVFMDLFWKNRRLTRQYDTIKQEFLQHPNIHKATITRFPQGSYITMGTFRAEGQDQTHQMGVFDVDEHYLTFFDIPLVSGRDFRFEDRMAHFRIADKPRTEGPRIMLNEAAAQKLGWDDPIGKQFGSTRSTPLGTVVGVLKDFHVWPLHRKIEPVVFTMNPYSAKHLYLKIGNQNVEETIQFMETKWKEFLPEQPFDFKFLDHSLTHAKYQNEIRLSRVFVSLSVLAIFIASLGLLSLIAFMAEQRTKEIGIRKVLGASNTNIIHILTKDFVLLVLVANIIAWPIAYYALESWLQNFAYRTHIGIDTFILSGFLALLIALATLTWQATKAANMNPVDTLRQE